MAQIDIGKIKMVWKNAWNSGTAYTKDDAVSHSGSSYICIQDGTNQNPSTATAYWELLAQAGTNGTNGTNGTDVGTVITTQGDILYRDGSGLQSLAAGTAGNVLQTGGAGANPSWGSVSSDYVRIANVNVTTGTSISFDNIFSTSDGYQSYKAIIHRFRPSNHKWLRFKWRNGGSDLTNNYRFRTDAWRYKGDNSQAVDNYSYNSDSYIACTYWSTRSDGETQGEIDFGNPSTSINGHTIRFSTVIYESDNGIIYNRSFGVRENTASYDGFSLVINDNSTNFTNFDVSVYGIK